MRHSAAIAWRQILSLRGDRKAWAAFALCLAFCVINVSPYVSYVSALGYELQAVEAYVIIGSSLHYFTGILLGALLLLSDAPFIGSRSPYEILRAGRRVWLRGQAYYILFSGLLYTFIAIVFTVIIASLTGSVYFENTWSEAMVLLAKRQPQFTILQFKLSFPYGEFIDTVSPYGAMLISLFFNSCYICLLSLCMFVVNLYSSRGFGWLAAILVHIGGYVIIANGFLMAALRNVSPLSLALPADLYTGQSGVSPLGGAAILVALIGLLVFISDRRARRLVL